MLLPSPMIAWQLVLFLFSPATAYVLPSVLVARDRFDQTRSRAVTASADAEALAALKRAFYGAGDSDEARENDDLPVGLLRDM